MKDGFNPIVLHREVTIDGELFLAGLYNQPPQRLIDYCEKMTRNFPPPAPVPQDWHDDARDRAASAMLAALIDAEDDIGRLIRESWGSAPDHVLEKLNRAQNATTAAIAAARAAGIEPAK